MAKNQDLTIRRGARFLGKFVAREGPNDTDAAIDLTTYTIQAQLRHARGGTLLASFTATKDPDQVTNKGKFSLSLATATTKAFDATRQQGFWDVVLITAANEVDLLAHGRVVFEDLVTQVA